MRHVEGGIANVEASVYELQKGWMKSCYFDRGSGQKGREIRFLRSQRLHTRIWKWKPKRPIVEVVKWNSIVLRRENPKSALRTAALGDFVDSVMA